MQAKLKIPRADSAVLQWSQNVLNLISCSPSQWGLQPSDVSDYAALHADFATKLTACEPSVRSKPAVVAKNESLEKLKSGALLLAYKIYADASVSEAMKVQIGMPPRAKPTQIPPPDSAPIVQIVSQSGFTVRIRLRDTDGARRGRAAHTAGASVFTFAGDEPPTDRGQWKFERSTGRVDKIDITFPATLTPGTKVWFTALWFNGRKQSGPMAQPIAANVAGGSVSKAA